MYKMVTSLFLDMCNKKMSLGYLNGAWGKKKKRKGFGRFHEVYYIYQETMCRK